MAAAKGKGKSKSTKSAKAKKAAAKKGNGAKPAKATKAAKPSVDLSAATEFAKKTFKEYGPCEVVRAVAKKYKSLKRGDVMSIAKSLKINPFTASRQFHLLRSGEVTTEAA